MPEATDQEWVFYRHFREGALDTMAGVATRSVYHSLLELISNAYDADATEVSLIYDPESSTLLLSDNGEGMGREGVNAFYGIGGSDKKVHPVSSKGRRKIGKYGIATILLSSLAGENGEYDLTTRREGLELTINEVFEGELRLDKPLPAVPREVGPSLHGTTIDLKTLGFKEGRAFNLGELKRRIQMGLHLLPDFKVFINQEEVTPRAIEKADEYPFDETGKHMGHVTGSLYITKGPTKMAGMHVYVNGRKYGDDTSLIDVGGFPLSLARRLVGILDANGLEDAISFDRGNFREDHPGVMELRDKVAERLMALRRYADSRSAQDAIDKLEARRPRMVKALTKKVTSVGLEGVAKKTEVAFSDTLPISTPATFDPASDQLLLNERYPSLVVTSTTKAPQYETAMVHAAAEAIALQRMGNNDSLALFLDTRGAVLSKLIAAHTGRQEEIFPQMAYQLREAGRITGRSHGGIRYLVECGALVESDRGKVMGSQLAHVHQRADGMLTLYDFLFPTYKTVVRSHCKKYAAALDRAGGSIEPFFLKMPGSKGSAYFVEAACADVLARNFSGDALQSKGLDPAGVCTMVAALPRTLSEIVSTSTGLTTETVQQIIAHAEAQNLQMRITPGKDPKYHYGDFITAYQHMRRNANRAQEAPTPPK